MAVFDRSVASDRERPCRLEAITDERLARLAKAGDQPALGELIRRFRGRIERLASSYFLAGGGRDDLIQHGLIALADAVGSYEPERAPDGLGAWIELCAARRMIAHAKGAAFPKHRALNTAVPLAAPAPSADDPDLTLEETLRGEPGEVRRQTLSLALQIWRARRP